MTVWRMRIARCIPKATNTHSEYVILIVLFRGNSGKANAPECYVTSPECYVTSPPLSVPETSEFS